MARIFDLYSQADPADARLRAGLGVGLTVVHRLVEMHGGTVAAHSEGPGARSEFVARRPLVPYARLSFRLEGEDPSGKAGKADAGSGR